MKTYKPFALVVLAACAAVSSAFGAYVEIGTGTSDTIFIPAYYNRDYNWSQVIYLQSEIGDGFQIGGISYYVNNSPSNYEMLDQRIYLKHTNLTVFADAVYDDPSTAGFTQVFQGNVTWDGSGWQTITFDTPFSYNGTDNLIVYWQNHDGNSVSSGPRFRYTSQSKRAKYKYADSSFPTVSGSRSSYCANVRLHLLDLGPGGATDPTPLNGAVDVLTNTVPTIAWTNPPTASYNAVYFSTNQASVMATNPAVRVLYDGSTLYTSYIHSAGLAPGVTYYWRVLESDSSFSSLGEVCSFTTRPLPINTFPWTEGFEHGRTRPLYWSEEFVDGVHAWKYQTGGSWDEPSTAHSGTYNRTL